MESKKYLTNFKSFLNEDIINHYIFVKEGQIELHKKDELINTVDWYQLVDFDDINKEELSQYFICTKQTTKCMLVNKTKLRDIFGDEMKNLLYKNWIKNMIHKEQDFNFLDLV